MKLSEFKLVLQKIEDINIVLENGKSIPSHFHITEVGQVDKKYIDCGGTIRFERKVGFQLWESTDVWHKLLPLKLLKIIELSESKLGIVDEEIEVEYQAETIGKFGIDFNGKEFILTNKETACLAEDACGIPQKEKSQFVEISSMANNCCTPNGSCC
jgi:hypothetical protein